MKEEFIIDNRAASVYSEYALINKLPVSGWVVSDEQDIRGTEEFDFPIYHLKDLPCHPDECSIILAWDRKYYGIIKKNLMDKGYYMIL